MITANTYSIRAAIWVGVVPLLAAELSCGAPPSEPMAPAAAPAAPRTTIRRLASHDEPRAPSPPFVRAWKARVSDQIEGYQIAGETLYFGTLGSYGAIDIKAGKLRWQYRTSKEFAPATVLRAGSVLYTAISRQRLAACDPATGRQVWSVPMRDYAFPMAFGDGVLYCWLDTGKLTALDVRTRKPHWSVRLSHGEPGGEDDGLSVAPVLRGGLYAPLWRGALCCLNPSTGATIWKYEPQADKRAPITGLAFARSQVFCGTRAGQVLSFDATHGGRGWHAGAPADIAGAPVVFGDRLVFAARDGVLRSLDLRTGRPRWMQSFTFERDPIYPGPVRLGELAVVSDRARLSAFDGAGHRAWQFDTEEKQFDQPLAVLPGGLLTPGSHEFCLFRPGTPASLPSGNEARLAEAKRLAARYDSLSEDEKERLVKLGDAAFDALYPRYRVLIVAAMDPDPAHAEIRSRAGSLLYD